MWTHEETAETAAAPARVWAVLADVPNWTAWDTSMESVTLEGPFAVGSTIVLHPKGQDPVPTTIIELVENQTFCDEAVMGETVLRFAHDLAELPGGGTRLTYRLTVTGPGGDEIGPMIAEDFPEAMAALLARART